jgi:hypothetical protein
MDTRRFTDSEGRMWDAFAADAVVAHGRQGAVLAFRPVDGDEDEQLRSTITFNSGAAADFALRTLGENELRRRLSLARMAVGGV